MRTPQRNFVVEFKSRRRQEKPSAQSIWGNADLKALAREVEEESSHLFNPSEPEASALEQAAAATSLADEGSGNESGDESIVGVGAAEETRIAAPLDHRTDPLLPETLSQAGGTSPNLPRRERSVRKARAKATRSSAKHALPSSAPDLHEGKSAPDMLVDNGAAVDELHGLEAENRRLRGLLVERLHNENRQLRVMLGRFSTSA